MNMTETFANVEKLLLYAKTKERTAHEISAHLCISITTTYRLINRLEEINWIRTMDSRRKLGGKQYIASVLIVRSFNGIT